MGKRSKKDKERNTKHSHGRISAATLSLLLAAFVAILAAVAMFSAFPFLPHQILLQQEINHEQLSLNERTTSDSERHLNRLHSQARTYSAQGRQKEAEATFMKVVQKAQEDTTYEQAPPLSQAYVLSVAFLAPMMINKQHISEAMSLYRQVLKRYDEQMNGTAPHIDRHRDIVMLRQLFLCGNAVECYNLGTQVQQQLQPTQNMNHPKMGAENSQITPLFALESLDWAGEAAWYLYHRAAELDIGANKKSYTLAHAYAFGNLATLGIQRSKRIKTAIAHSERYSQNLLQDQNKEMAASTLNQDNGELAGSVLNSYSRDLTNASHQWQIRRQKILEIAQQHAEQALRLQPADGSGNNRRTLSIIHHELRDELSAREELKRAMSLDPTMQVDPGVVLDLSQTKDFARLQRFWPFNTEHLSDVIDGVTEINPQEWLAVHSGALTTIATGPPRPRKSTPKQPGRRRGGMEVPPMELVHVVQGLVPPGECAQLITLAEAHAAIRQPNHKIGANGVVKEWQIAHVPVVAIPRALRWLNSRLHTVIFPFFAHLFELEANNLRLLDAQIVRYDALIHTSKPVQTAHATLSAVMGLNSAIEYAGGGTYFEKIDQTVPNNEGEMIFFNGKLRHAQNITTQGIRYVLSLFVGEVIA